ncbi:MULTISPECIES: ArdC family protein [Pirellulaceae]|nr:MULTISPECIES: zincin-like metallopeptidase domain-containing protein [Pirellulaceae]
MSKNSQIRTEITNRIIEALESGNLPPWRKPWANDANAGFPRNVSSQRSYSGVNPLLLTLASERHNLQSRWWATFKKWDNLGGKVMRRPKDVPSGQWGTKIVFCAPISKTKIDDKGEEVEDKFFMLKTYTVFNIDQIEGDHLDYLRVGIGDDTRSGDIETFERADAAIAATEADIRFGGNKAFYDPLSDHIQVPRREQFNGSDFYETILHELVHWTEHKERLNWDRTTKGDHAYPLGELIAEIGACYLCGELGVPMADRIENHASYLKSWLSAMKQDAGFIFRATSQASKATDYILSFSQEPAEAVSEEATV